MPWVVTPRHHMAFQGGLEGRGGVALLEVVLEAWHIWTIIVTSAFSMLCSRPELTMYSNNWITPTHNSITHFTFDFAPTKWKLPHSDSSAAMQTLLEWTRILQRRGHHP